MKPIEAMAIEEDGAEPAFTEVVDQLAALLSKDDEPGSPYTPYLRAVHSGTRGYAQRVPGSLVPRLHDFLSRHEFHLFVLFDWRHDRFSNIREQFSLPLALTQAVALREGLEHPKFRGKPSTMSVDFMLTNRNGGWAAVDFKEKKEASLPKTKTKMAIVSLALNEAGVPHKVMTEDDIPMVFVRNIRFLRSLLLPFDPPPLGSSDLATVDCPLQQLLRAGRMTIFEAASTVSQATKLPVARISRACLWFIANRRWKINLSEPVGPDYPLTFLA